MSLLNLCGTCMEIHEDSNSVGYTHIGDRVVVKMRARIEVVYCLSERRFLCYAFTPFTWFAEYFYRPMHVENSNIPGQIRTPCPHQNLTLSYTNGMLSCTWLLKWYSSTNTLKPMNLAQQSPILSLTPIMPRLCTKTP